LSADECEKDERKQRATERTDIRLTPHPKPFPSLPQKCELFLTLPVFSLRSFARFSPPATGGPDVYGCEKNEDRLAAPLIGEQPNFGAVPSGAWELLGHLQDGFLLAPPLGAVLHGSGCCTGTTSISRPRKIDNERMPQLDSRHTHFARILQLASKPDNPQPLPSFPQTSTNQIQKPISPVETAAVNLQ